MTDSRIIPSEEKMPSSHKEDLTNMSFVPIADLQGILKSGTGIVPPESQQDNPYMRATIDQVTGVSSEPIDTVIPETPLEPTSGGAEAPRKPWYKTGIGKVAAAATAGVVVLTGGLLVRGGNDDIGRRTADELANRPVATAPVVPGVDTEMDTVAPSTTVATETTLTPEDDYPLVIQQNWSDEQTGATPTDATDAPSDTSEDRLINDISSNQLPIAEDSPYTSRAIDEVHRINRWIQGETMSIGDFGWLTRKLEEDGKFREFLSDVQAQGKLFETPFVLVTPDGNHQLTAMSSGGNMPKYLLVTGFRPLEEDVEYPAIHDVIEVTAETISGLKGKSLATGRETEIATPYVDSLPLNLENMNAADFPFELPTSTDPQTLAGQLTSIYGDAVNSGNLRVFRAFFPDNRRGQVEQAAGLLAENGWDNLADSSLGILTAEYDLSDADNNLDPATGGVLSGEFVTIQNGKVISRENLKSTIEYREIDFLDGTQIVAFNTSTR